MPTAIAAYFLFEDDSGKIRRHDPTEEVIVMREIYKDYLFEKEGE